MTDPSPDEPIDPRLAATTAYLAGFLTGALILWRYRKIEFAAFHAWQAILFSVTIVAAVLGLWTVPIAGQPLAIGGIALGAVTWVFLAVQAYRGRWTMLPLLGDIAWERSRRPDRDPPSSGSG